MTKNATLLVKIFPIINFIAIEYVDMDWADIKSSYNPTF